MGREPPGTGQVNGLLCAFLRTRRVDALFHLISRQERTLRPAGPAPDRSTVDSMT